MPTQLRAYRLILFRKYLTCLITGLFLFPLSGVISSACYGQNKISEASKSQWSGLPDTTRVDWTNGKSAQNILLSRKDSAIYYANVALEGAKKIMYIHGIAQALSLKCQIAKHFDDDFILSEKFGQEALSYFEKTGNKAGLDTLYYYLFYASFSESKFEEAIDYSEKYYAEALQKNNQDEIYTSLGAMYEVNRQMGNYEKSFSYAQKLYDIAVRTGNKIWLVSSLWNLAQLFTLVEDYPIALDYYKRVREMSDREVRETRIHEDKEIRFEMEFAEAFSRMNQFDSAWYYYGVYKPTNPAFARVYWVSTGECYVLQGHFLQALENFRLGLTEDLKHNDVNEVIRAVLDIAKVYQILDSSKAALKFGRQGLDMALQTRVNQNIRDGYKILSDSYDRLGRIDSSNYYFRKYSVIKDVVSDNQIKGRFAAYYYEQRIEMMGKEKQIQEIRLQKETLLKNFLIGGIVLLLLLASIVIRNSQLKRRSDARRRALAENEMHIQKLESEKSMAELLQQRTELEMKALRAQMSPHFIFNCLNSINQFIICNNATKAADYLTKFAKLIRMVLEKSGKPFIPLEEELNCLQLYLDLEAIRFENPFSYEINCQGIDKTSVMIPSLLIQPFVENAIWHGLHPSGGSHGEIKINLSLENDILHCEISDNGIGLVKSAALKGKAQGNKKSLGIELTKQRLRLADPLDQKEMDVSIRNLMDVTGNSTGTCVHIKIPVKNYMT